MMGGVESFMGGFGMAAGMWIFLFSMAAPLAFLVWALSETLRREERPVVVRSVTFEDVMRRRLERSEISAREFEDVLQQLKDS